MALRGCGSYQKRINEVNDIDFRDFVTPWNFFAVFLIDDRVVIKWLQEHGLLLNNMYCIRCNKLQRGFAYASSDTQIVH